MTHDHHHAGARRAARLVVTAALLGGVLALVPVPRLVAVAAAMETETRRPAVVPGGSAITPAGADAPVAAGAGSTAREEGVAGFVMIGATAAGEGEALARVRTRGRWGEWFELHHSADHGPDAGSSEAATAATASASEPVWVGEADAYEVRLPEGVDVVDVHLVREGDREVGITADEPAESAPTIRPRSSWGARPPSEGPYYAGDLHMAVVHHSAGANSYTAAQVPSIIRAMQAYHMDANGWYDLAYNFVVDRFGVVWEGRGGGAARAVVGGHSSGFNTGTTGVVVMGDLTSTTPSAAAVNAVSEVIAWKFAVHGVDPSSTVPFTTIGSTSRAAGTYTFPRIIGHRDVGSTGCPGSRLYAQLPAIRSRVGSRYGAYTPEQPRMVFGVDLGGDGRDEVIRYRRGAPADELWRPGPTGTMAPAALSVGGTYRPFVGDFDGDSREDVFWHGTGSTPDHLWYGAPGGAFRSVAFDVRGAFTPFVGDFDGNGADDIYWFAPGLPPDVIWYGNASRVRHSVNRSVTQTAPPFVADFDGDGRDDIFWYSPGTTPEVLWYGMPDRTFQGHQRSITPSYVPVPGDFDGDGLDEALWYAPGAATDHLWHAEGPRNVFTGTAIAVGGPFRPYALDAAADGATDVVWYAPGAVVEEIWSFQPGGGHTTTRLQVSGTYDVVVGDFNGDGREDLLWSAATLAGSHRWMGQPDGSLVSQPAG
jgi:N-acetylmuramoyl-L-alanine amidase/FG-GAP-like repeat/FG-GAP repeat